MENRDRIEFYHGKKVIAVVKSSMVPTVGSLISIQRNAWRVVGIVYALDHADDFQLRGMRCNVDLEPHK